MQSTAPKPKADESKTKTKVFVSTAELKKASSPCLVKIESEDLYAPVAVRHLIGWVHSGPVPSTSALVSTCFRANTEDSLLADEVQSWYETESFGTYIQADTRSKADQQAVSILESTTKYDGTRNVVGMLWTDDSIKLPDNYYSSLIQFKSLEQRLSKQLSLKEQYSKSVRDDLEKWYIIEVEKHDPNCRTPREWYVPHHPVVKPHKLGKVCRILNGASKFHGYSLNNALLGGPDLLQTLLHVLLRFRQYIFAQSADIEGKFLQVGVLEEDQRSLRFLWRGNPTEPVSVFQNTRHVFRAKVSPTCANFALLKTAVDNETEYSEAALAVQQNFYLDDFLISVQPESEAFSFNKQLVTMLKLGGFNLTNFVSNILEFANELNSTNNDAVEPVKDIFNESSDASHVLGSSGNTNMIH